LRSDQRAHSTGLTSPSQGYCPQGHVLASPDGNGQHDLVFGAYGAHDVTLFLNDGAELFLPPAGCGVDGTVSAVGVADVYNDRANDVLANIGVEPPTGGVLAVPFSEPPAQRTTNGTNAQCGGAIALDWFSYCAAHPTALGGAATPSAACRATRYSRTSRPCSCAPALATPTTACRTSSSASCAAKIACGAPALGFERVHCSRGVHDELVAGSDLQRRQGVARGPPIAR